ncbi:MAG: hypothetical protein WCS15_01340 [Prevotella sp.]
MEQPNIQARKEYQEVAFNVPSIVEIPNTKRKVKMRGIKPYTIECLTKLWLSRDLKTSDNSSEALKDLCEEPYFSVKEALLFVLNDYWKIRLFYPIMWRFWGKVLGYTEDQMMPIIATGKKKLPLMEHWRNMVFSVDMRADWMRLTKEEASQFQAEQISAVNRLSSKSSPLTELLGDSSSD